MPYNTTIEKKGKKNIIINTQNQEKCRITVLLGILADGFKLPPLIIFKAKENGTVFKELSNLKYVKDGSIFIYCNENAWATKKIISLWNYKIWKKYLEVIIFRKGEGVIILDRASSHLDNDEVLNELKYTNQKIFYIPSGTTRLLQPLDVSVNKPFKTAIKNKYIQYCIERNITSARILRKDIVEWIHDIWYDPTIITPELIIKSFKVTGFTNKFDLSEDYLFKVFKKLSDEGVIEKEKELNKNELVEQEIEDEKDNDILMDIE